jgi:hypothetical protein
LEAGVSCCGAIKTLKAMVQGNILLNVNRLFALPRPKYEYADTRLAACRMCQESTWLTATEYAAFLGLHKVETIKNISDLSVLPKLEKKDYQKKTKLFCRICKCWLPAKTYVKTEQCPLKKWSE